MVTAKMNWTGPNVIHFSRKSQLGPDQFILVVTISFWLRPNHNGQVQINLVRPKPFWTDQNCFGHIEGQGIKLHSLQVLNMVLQLLNKVILQTTYFNNASSQLCQILAS
jgi:hypothetical protein